MKDKINRQEAEFLSNQLEKISNYYNSTMSLDTIKQQLETKIKPEVQEKLKMIFKDILSVIEDFPYELNFKFKDDIFIVSITINSENMY